MADAIFAHKDITIKKSLFSTKVVYAPTQSTVKSIVLEYGMTEGERLERLLKLPVDKIADELQRKGKPAATPIGHYRFEVCLSNDRQFCALQFFRFTDFRYAPVSEPRFFEGQEVETIVKLIQ